MKTLPVHLQQTLGVAKAAFACISGKEAHEYSNEIGAALYAVQDYLHKARQKYYTEMQPVWNKQAKDRKAAAGKRNKLVTKWCKLHLCVGDVVRVSGTRDGDGIRMVIAINGDQFTAHQLQRAVDPGSGWILRGPVYSASKTIVVDVDMTPQNVTTHAMSKITHIASNLLTAGVTPTSGNLTISMVPITADHSFKSLANNS